MKNIIVYFFTGLLVLCCDQGFKLYALTHFLIRPVDIVPFVSCHVTMNRGISWGMLYATNDVLFGLLSIAIVMITGVIVWQSWIDYKAGQSLWGHVLVIAGSLSNSIDRMVYHGVVDFIICSYKEWSWPVFNIADVAIVFGVYLMLLQNVRRPSS